MAATITNEIIRMPYEYTFDALISGSGFNQAVKFTPKSVTIQPKNREGLARNAVIHISGGSVVAEHCIHSQSYFVRVGGL